MTSPLFTEDDFEGDSVLGPHYFAARRIVAGATKHLEDDGLDEMVKGITDKIYEKLQNSVEACMWSDAQSNLQSKMWHMVDEIMKGVLSGDKWIMDRYALGSKYDCEKSRAAIAKHVGNEVLALRISDLENEIERLKGRT